MKRWSSKTWEVPATLESSNVLSSGQIHFSSRKRNVLFSFCLLFLLTEFRHCPSTLLSHPPPLLLLPTRRAYQMSFSDGCLSIFLLKKKSAEQKSYDPGVLSVRGGRGWAVCHRGGEAVSGVEVGQETGSSFHTSFTCRPFEYSAWRLGLFVYNRGH